MNHGRRRNSFLRPNPSSLLSHEGERLAGGARNGTHYQALRTLANRLVGILHGCLRTHTLYNEHLAWHNEPDKLSPAA